MLYSLKIQRLCIQYVLADLLTFILSSLFLALLKFSDEINALNIEAYLIILIALGIMYMGLLYLGGNYETNMLLDVKWNIYLRSITYTSALFFVASFYIRSVSYSRVYFTALFATTFFIAILTRLMLNKLHRYNYREEIKFPMMAVGFENSEPGMLEKIVKELGLRVIAEFDTQKAMVELLHRQERMALASQTESDDEMGILLYEEGNEDFQELISFCELNYIPLYVLPSAIRMHAVPLQAVNHKGVLIFGPKDLLVDGVSKRLKRTIDVFLAIIGITLTSWLMLIVWMLVKITSRGPGFYAQERLGLDGKIIKIYKFRTMVSNSELMLKELLEDEAICKSYYESYKLENDPRVTSVGWYLRHLSLDELPQFWNILRGDLSFVGPRPIIPPELARYGASGKLILRVKPGLTGLWQVNGRNDVSYEERIKLDLYYIHNWSSGLDFKIIFQTIPSVVFGRGAS